MDNEARAAALTGPWLAVLADRYGFVYDSVDDARDSAEDGEVTISVVRGSAAPTDRDGTTGVALRLPGSYRSGDQAYVLDVAYLDDPADPSVGAEARYEQARAMAAGLNAAAGAAPTEPCDSALVPLGGAPVERCVGAVGHDGLHQTTEGRRWGDPLDDED